MEFLQLLSIELLKTKRSKILPVLLIMLLFAVITSFAIVIQNITPEYRNAWQTLFMQSSLGYGLYLLPFCMVIVCAMLAGRETKNNGMSKMLSLPVKRSKFALAKFIVLLCYLTLEILIFILVFVVSGVIFDNQMFNIEDTMPVTYIVKRSIYQFLLSLPSISIMWLLTVIVEKTALSVGLNIILILPSISIVTTPY